MKHKGSFISYVNVNGLKQYRPKDIANNFGQFYLELGTNLAKSIVSGTTTLSSYLEKIPRNLNSIVLKQTTPLVIDNLIKKLPNKSSQGNDQISNLMLKSLCSSITFPLCHVFNHSILEGKFPELMKWAEVIPLYKGKKMDVMVNYHPISLLITMSKLLEKVIYNVLYSSQ